MDKSYVADQRQERSKERKRKRWLKWLCNPRTLQCLIWLGQIVIALIKLLKELGR